MGKKAIVIGAVIMGAIMIGCGVKWIIGLFHTGSNDAARRDKEGRYITIVNDTGAIINTAFITVGEGTEIENTRWENPDKESFSVEIPKAYLEETTFTVNLEDRYGFKYKKMLNNVPEKGMQEARITKDDRVEEPGGWLKEVEMFFNGD